MPINYSKILPSWNLVFSEIQEKISFYGSPERSDFRIAINDKTGQIYVLEKINPHIALRKEEIAQHLFSLRQANPTLPIVAYLQNQENSFVSEIKNEYWLLSPFVVGVPLDRIAYLDENWRGEVMADFILHFKKTADKIFTKQKNVFLLPEYVEKICADMKKFNPEEREKINPIIKYLQKNFFQIYDQIPIAFCHGDYHPINIIWGEKEIKGVIDWEFCGFKPEMYDVANMVGCLGMEHPDTLNKKIVLNFLQKLKQTQEFSALSWQYFVDMIIALRFAWLSEWLRKKDTEMIELEIDYLFLLLDNKNILEKIWKIKKSPKKE
ncbi:MAG TPA: phosphotransferase [Candidatus Magasanikbacteria bacterium]|nr:phosphotransferase [Candidatus Magasanikbacteria bacterium]